MGSIRLKLDPQEGKDLTTAQEVIDSEGYKWPFAPNQTRVLPDDGNRTTLAANATIKYGTDTQQLDAPEVIAHDLPHEARS